MDRAKPRIVLGATVGQTVNAFMFDQAKFLAKDDFEVHIVADFLETTIGQGETGEVCEGVYLHHIKMDRKFSPLQDVKSLAHWRKVLLNIKPDLVVLGTPKAGLLGILASASLRIHPRVYMLRGLRLEGLTGLRAHASYGIERLVCALSDQVLCVSHSLRDTVIEKGIANADKVHVLGWGGSNGVDIGRFRPPTELQKREARQAYQIPLEAPVIGFAGRLTPDKGLTVLMEAMNRVHRVSPDVHLMVVGALDASHPLGDKDLAALKAPWCTHVDALEDMTEFYWCIDIFCLPSKREGLPNVNIEASSCGLPVVTTDATGCRDTVLDNSTGYLVPFGSPEALSTAILGLFGSKKLGKSMGMQGRDLVKVRFSQQKIWKRTSAYFHHLCKR